MREVAPSCLAVLASMVFFSFFWAPYVELISHNSDLREGRDLVDRVVVYGAVTAYLTWPQGEPKNIEATDQPQTDRSRGSTPLVKLHRKAFIAQQCWLGTVPERFTNVPTSLLATLTRSYLS